jgi:hypothetical protein
VERNPYSPPSSIVADVDQGGRKRLVLLWLCAAYHGAVAILIGTLMSLMVARVPIRNVPTMQPGYQFWNKPWFILNALLAISAVITLIQLLKLRKSATYFATAVFVLRLVVALGLLPGTTLFNRQHAAAVIWVGLPLNAFVVVYIWLLVRKGVLK